MMYRLSLPNVSIMSVYEYTDIVFVMSIVDSFVAVVPSHISTSLFPP